MTTTPSNEEELRLTIAEYGPLVDTPRDQYAHNIVSMALISLAGRYGIPAANAAIEDFGLEAKGWKTQKGRETHE